VKIIVDRPVEMVVDAIRCVLPVNYEEEDMPNDYPHRKGQQWDITIDIETGKIRDWPKGIEARHIYMKVVDGGRYYLMHGADIVATRESEYVPACIPGEYGDYVEFDINTLGTILNWKPRDYEIVDSFWPEVD